MLFFIKYCPEEDILHKIGLHLVHKTLTIAEIIKITPFKSLGTLGS